MKKDIVDLLRGHGYGVVEGAEAVRQKIKEIGNVQEYGTEEIGERDERALGVAKTAGSQ